MKYKKFKPNDYVMVIKNGKVVKEGPGLSVLFNELTTNIMVVPSTAFDGTFAFDDIVTGDYQSVCVQGVTTYMITDYARAARMLDFVYQPRIRTEENITRQMALLEKRINNIIKATVIREVGKYDVRSIIRLADEMADRIENALAGDESIAKLGVSITAVNILGINPKNETRKALEAAAREQILKEQDDAIYKRRNAAIEQERIIKENEINTEIKVAEKEKEKEEMEQEREFALREKALTEKLRIENEEIAGKIELEKKNREYTELETENERIKSDQQAYAVTALVNAYNNLNAALVEACAMAQTDPGTLMARAFMNLGENADKIGTLNMTPDLLQTIAACGGRQ